MAGPSAGLGRELDHAGQVVLEHYVHAAHRAGCSWTRIGERLGITRQAARQRFGISPELPLDADELEVRPRLQACLDQALAEGAADGRDEIDWEYLLLGLLHVGVAAAALDRLGVTRQGVRDAMRALFGPAAGSSGGTPGLSHDAQQALDGARRLAWQAGQPYVGTEPPPVLPGHGSREPGASGARTPRGRTCGRQARARRPGPATTSPAQAREGLIVASSSRGDVIRGARRARSDAAGAPYSSCGRRGSRACHLGKVQSF